MFLASCEFLASCLLTYTFQFQFSGLLFSHGPVTGFSQLYFFEIDHPCLSPCDREIWPVTLTFAPNIDRIRMNLLAKYLGQRSFFGRPFIKRFALCYRSIVLSVCLSVCLSVTLVYCGQTVGRIKMKLGMQVGLGSGHIVLGGDPAAPPPKGQQKLGIL